jgi:hypothetical protein
VPLTLAVGLDPWTKSIPYPLLVVNSEEFAVGAEWKIFAEQIAGTVTGEDAPALVFSIRTSSLRICCPFAPEMDYR